MSSILDSLSATDELTLRAIVIGLLGVVVFIKFMLDVTESR